MQDTLAAAIKNSDVLFERGYIERCIENMALAISRDYEGDRPVYLTVMHGGMLFSSLLALELSVDPDFDYLHATRYRGQMVGSGLAWLHRPETPLQGRRVLIVDDILDEGHTLRAIRNWCEDAGAADVRVAVLAEKIHDRRVEGAFAEYIGLEVPDRYVFGFGMDFNEQGRNLPAIYALREEV